jgi:hypothetical protein
MRTRRRIHRDAIHVVSGFSRTEPRIHFASASAVVAQAVAAAEIH